MEYKRILTVQDISCVGQCSLTVALPILSACGFETAVLPSAVLSTHTAGFKGFTFRDLTEDMPAVKDHWQRENIRFDCIYTGYLGSAKQAEYVRDILNTMGNEGCIRVVDPAFADNGRLYPPFDGEYVKAMRELVPSADVLLPNITEACYLTDTEYCEKYDRKYIEQLMKKLSEMCNCAVVLTGVGFDEGKTGVAVLKNDELSYYEHHRLDRCCHGTGDVFASAFTGALMHGKELISAAQIAADYTVRCIENTVDDPNHWYGVKFEPLLSELINNLR